MVTSSPLPIDSPATVPAVGVGSGRFRMPTAAREDLVLMPQHDWLLKLAKELHTTLDVETLLALFSRRVAELVAHAGCEYAYPGQDAIVRSGESAPHSCHYELVVEDRALGAVRFMRDTPFETREIATVEDLLANLVHPLRNALLYREALLAAARDPLTGVSNRAGLPQVLEREVQLARRHRSPLSLVMIDADEFKALNDRHGHLAGDAVLRALAGCIQACIRDSDYLFRYGGEEFVVVLSRTDRPGALLLAERIRAAVAALRVPYASGTIPVTVSAGVSALGECDEASALLDRADQALYLAKAAGRNRVAAEPGPREDAQSAAAG